MFRLGLVRPVDGAAELCGVAVVGRPPNRNNDDGQTAEVLRVATDGTQNACSALYGAAARSSKAMGFSRILTYTLDSETGASLRGTGWVMEEEGIVSKWTLYEREGHVVYDRPHFGSLKRRWVRTLNPRVDWVRPSADSFKAAIENPQMELA